MKPKISRRTVLAGGTALAIGGSKLLAKTTSREPILLSSDNAVLSYRRPAQEWVEALPIGNGCMGAMVYGGAPVERIQLSEHTLWAGGPHDYANPNGLAALPEIRRLIFAEKFEEAIALMNEKFMSIPLYQLPYQTAGEIEIEFPGHETVKDYQRELLLGSATARTSYRVGDVVHHRSAFISHPDQVLVIAIWADIPGGVSFSARFRSPQKATRDAFNGVASMAGVSGDAQGIPGQVRFCALMKPVCKGGALRTDGERVVVQDADIAILYVTLATSYGNYKDVSGNAEEAARNRLDRAVSRGYDRVSKDHFADHRHLFSRVEIDLGSSRAELPTDARISQFNDGGDPGLAALYFQYGRYLMIACSRPGGQPANLQGIWNDSMDPPWGAKYTVNINTEMNYWPVETCALGECHEPLFKMLSEVAETGKRTAEIQYGARGWVLHHNTDGWRGTAPIDGASWGVWPSGGAWLCTHMWQHYLFSGDKHALARHYPVMKGAAEFFLDTLVPHPKNGWLLTCPSTSPENAHHPNAGTCAGPTMDMQILRDLFDDCADASEVLGVDKEFREKMRETRRLLAPMQIGHLGQLQEWLEDWDEHAPEVHHRHVSHLYGLFPSRQVDSLKTPELAAAARKSLAMRGDEGTGWSLAWKINIWARLFDGDHAYKLIQMALRPQGHGGGGVYPNLFDAHPPFQIDGNFGFTSGVAEMLLQSDLDEMRLLPALPAAWPKGAISGLRARGGHEVAIAWEGGKLTEAKVKIGWRGKTTVHYIDQVREMESKPGAVISWTP